MPLYHQWIAAPASTQLVSPVACWAERIFHLTCIVCCGPPSGGETYLRDNSVGPSGSVRPAASETGSGLQGSRSSQGARAASRQEDHPVAEAAAASEVPAEAGEAVPLTGGEVTETAQQRRAEDHSRQGVPMSNEVRYIMSRAATVQSHFPQAVATDDFLFRLEMLLGAHGFTGSNSIGKPSGDLR